MPLIEGKSDKARSENIRTEIVEGHKPPKQAAAIAYSVQRKAGGKDHKMAKDSTGADPGAPHEHFLQKCDAIHKIAADCMGYDRKRK